MSLSVTSVGWAARDYKRWDEFVGWPLQRDVADDLGEGWFDAVACLGKRGHKYLSNATRYLLAATIKAVETCEIPLDATKDRTGVIVGTNQADYQVRRQFDRIVREEGADALNAVEAPNTAVNLPASHVAIRFGYTGPNVTLTNQHLAGLETFYVADRLMRRNRLAAMVCGAVEDSSADAPGGAAVMVLEDGERATRPSLARIDAIQVDFLSDPQADMSERTRERLLRGCANASALWLLSPCESMAARTSQSLQSHLTVPLHDLSSMNNGFGASHTLLPFLQLFWLMANGHEGHVIAVSPLGHVVMFNLQRGDS